jgi:hypothetical protein
MKGTGKQTVVRAPLYKKNSTRPPFPFSTDHVEARNRILLPPYKDDVLNVPRRLQTEIYEIYQHAPASYTGNVTYGTQAWFDVLNPVAHAAGKSSNIGIYLGGYLAFALIVSTEETPAGAVLTIELILGAPLKGFDPVTPDLGYTQPQAEWINSNIMLPMYVTYIDNMPQRSEMWNVSFWFGGVALGDQGGATNWSRSPLPPPDGVAPRRGRILQPGPVSVVGLFVCVCA